jgi:hypothetical protein
MIKKIDNCFYNRNSIRDHLMSSIPMIQDRARKGFDALKEIVEDA